MTYAVAFVAAVRFKESCVCKKAVTSAASWSLSPRKMFVDGALTANSVLDAQVSALFSRTARLGRSMCGFVVHGALGSGRANDGARVAATTARVKKLNNMIPCAWTHDTRQVGKAELPRRSMPFRRNASPPLLAEFLPFPDCPSSKCR